MQRAMAFDVGERRIVVAVSDALGMTAQGLETYTRTDDEDADIRHLLALAEGYKPVTLVFGMPRNMDGSYGPQAAYTRAFAEKLLAGWDGDSAYYDERLTTAGARRMLLEADMSRAKRKKVIDKIAAVLILEGYMGANGY